MTRSKALQTIYSPVEDGSWDDYRNAEEAHERAIQTLLEEL